MTMIESMAKAMAENAGFKWEHCAQSQWLSDVRIGLKVLREPTTAMSIAGMNTQDGSPTTAFKLMIDAALSEVA